MHPASKRAEAINEKVSPVSVDKLHSRELSRNGVKDDMSCLTRKRIAEGQQPLEEGGSAKKCIDRCAVGSFSK